MFSAHALPILNGRLADVGSGGGFPGLPLKLIVPDLRVLLIESNARKVVFLREVVRALDLSTVDVKWSRFEDFPVPNAKFDYITARALGRWTELLRWAAHALNSDGSVLLWLGSKDADELFHARGWSWRRAIAIPNAKQRVLLVGRPKH
jgi:16S rRNA (guanine527-N7)-methyltransferase